MPQQELFFTQQVGDRRVEVLKTYDQSYAREVFRKIDDTAMKSLARALEIERHYDHEDIPASGGPEYDEFLWEELSESSVEDVRQSPMLYSFFIVTETKGGKVKEMYVSADWPSAETFAKFMILGSH